MRAYSDKQAKEQKSCLYNGRHKSLPFFYNTNLKIFLEKSVENPFV
jgi:hypothetical protein